MCDHPNDDYDGSTPMGSLLRNIMKPKYNYYDWQYVSRNVSYSQSAGKVENFKTGETIRNVDWIYKSVDGDSMVCFASKGKRGYFNKFTGKVVIKPQYKRAWIFSEGLACVEENDTLFFINHKTRRSSRQTLSSMRMQTDMSSMMAFAS